MEKIDSFCGGTPPKPLMSNGPRLKLEFQSLLASRYSRGFKASYSFTESKLSNLRTMCYVVILIFLFNVLDFGIRTGMQEPSYPCAFVFNSNVSRTGYFHSPNYPGFYPRDTECYYFFHGNVGEKVHLHYNYFDVEGVLPWVSNFLHNRVFLRFHLLFHPSWNINSWNSNSNFSKYTRT